MQEAAWLEQQEALLAMQAALPVQPIYTRIPAKRLRATPEQEDAESQQYSPYPRFSRCSLLQPCVFTKHTSHIEERQPGATIQTLRATLQGICCWVSSEQLNALTHY